VAELEQLDLFADEAAPRRKLTIQERFVRFHAQFPDVYALFKRFAFEVRDSGRAHYGSKGIFERVRWHYATSSGGGADEFKLNNSFSSRFARLLIEEHPEFEGFFELRRLRAE
jgi:hypothetical protein